MSPVKKASAVDSLRRATAPAPATTSSAPETNGRSGAPKPKPTRITLDLNRADYDDLNRWVGWARQRVSATPGRQVTIAKALRAMIRATTRDETMALVVLDLIREDGE